MSTCTSAQRSWPAAASAVPAARRLVREQLQEHGQQVLSDSAELIVSELVGNVVLHVGGEVEVTVAVHAAEVVIEVSDDSPLSPHLRVFSSTSSTGRGMRLVHSLSAEHGVRARGSGKTIWVRLTPEIADRDDADIAESFADVDWLAQLTEVGDEDGDVRAAA